MKGYFLITGYYKDNDATAKLNAIRDLVEPATAVKAEYDIIYSHYHKARAELFAKLPYMVREVLSFPLFEDFKNVLWKIAEYRGENGESVVFTRKATTMIDYRAETWEVVA